MSLSQEEIYSLKQPCKNRGLTLEVLPDNNISISGKFFDVCWKAEDYLSTIPRIDWNKR